MLESGKHLGREQTRPDILRIGNKSPHFFPWKIFTEFHSSRRLTIHHLGSLPVSPSHADALGRQALSERREWLTVNEFADALGITRACVRRWLLERRVSSARIGRLVRIH